MTSPIKPPGGTPPRVPSVDELKEGTRSKESTAAFSAEPVAKPAEADAAQGAAGPLDTLVNAVRAGELDAAGAVDRLVAELVQGPLAAGLDAAGREALEAHLRDALADDPNISQLVKDLGRGS